MCDRDIRDLAGCCDDSIESWAEKEFEGAALGDRRRNRRLVKIAAGLSRDPDRAISSSCGDNGASPVSIFFDRPEVDISSVLSGHFKETAKRCVCTGRVFAIQDTTYLDFSSHKDLEGLGHIGRSEKGRGLLMHNVLAVSPEKVPLGVLGIDIWARDLKKYGCSKDRYKRPVEEKESNKWLWGLAQAESVIPETQSTLLIGDRESDIFELFCARRRSNIDLLVRVCRNRLLEAPEGENDAEVVAQHRDLLSAVNGSEELGSYVLEVPRQANRKARTARMSAKAVEVIIKPPARLRKKESPVKLYCVIAKEVDTPDDVEALEWILLTTLPVNDFETALYIIDAYSVRWVIEEFHRVLKSGSKVEDMQFETLDRMLPAIAVASVVAWRVLSLSKQGRRTPDNPASDVCAEDEKIVLENWLKAKRKKWWLIETVGDFVRGVANLGGFMARKCDGHPGTKTLWRGIRRLEDFVSGYRLASASKIA